MSITVSAGKASILPRGAWSSAATYAVLDLVTNSGNAYLAKQDVPVGTALDNTSFWLLLVQKGDTGATGNGIASVEKTGTSGLVDTYTITYTNGNSDTFTVTNGADGADGADGQDGAPGADATITGATATVDANTGTPSVTVTLGGTPGARTFAFDFKNLKGAQGAPGQDGTVVVANPTLAGTEANLTGLEVAGTKYKIPDGVEVIIPDSNNQLPTGKGYNYLASIFGVKPFVVFSSNAFIWIPVALAGGVIYFIGKSGGSNTEVTYINYATVTSSLSQVFTTAYTTINLTNANQSNPTAKLETLKVGATNYRVLPAVTSSDEGKLLGVDSSGNWAAVSIPAANGNSF